MKTLRIVLISFAMLTAIGCTPLMSASERAAKEAGNFVHYYCESLPTDLRLQFRYQVNQHAAPHVITVECANGISPFVSKYP